MKIESRFDKKMDRNIHGTNLKRYVAKIICLKSLATYSNLIAPPERSTNVVYSHCVRENDLRQPVSWRFPGKLPTVSWANRFPQPCSLYVICFIESPATVTATSIPAGQSAIFAWLRSYFFPSHRKTSPCGTPA